MTACPACGSASPAGARFCPTCGVEIGSEPADTVSERKLATLLFVDIVGSTAAATDQDPERVRATLERFYDAMDAEIRRAGGTAEKFAGDAVLAVFGVPTSHEDDAERALHVALSMQRRVGELFGAGLAIRAGVNTGDVVVGRPREGSSFVTGDAVNVARRLEEAAGPGETIAGERTALAVRGAFELGEPHVLPAKGKQDGVVGRKVIRALSLMRPRGARGLGRVFVGRDTELDLLVATYRRAAGQGEPHLVTIVGDAGVGKSRLVRELWERLGGEAPAPLRRTGRCLPYGSGITYWPLGEMLKEHLALLESDDAAVILDRLGDQQMLGHALGLDLQRHLHPLAVREQLHDAFVAFFTELVAERPTVALVEDVHWAEEDLLELLDRLVRDVPGPLVVLATARPELLDRRPGWGGGRRNTATIWLERLGLDDAVRMLEGLLSASPTESLRELVAARAEGNPFFVEEIVGALVDEGVIEREDGGRWQVRGDAAAAVVPDSIQSLLAARLDMLPTLEKEALQAASVLGRIFWRGPLVRLLDGREPDLALLEERDLIRRRAGSSVAGEEEWAIKHALTREVAYASIPKARSARLHASFADWIEVRAPRDDYASLLAHHYAEAVRPENVDLAWSGEEAELDRLRDRAVVWLTRAAELAQGRYEIEEALDLLHRAVPLVGNDIERSNLWRRIGLANALRFDGEAFWTAMQSSLEVCPDRQTCADTYSLLGFHTSARSGMWRSRPSRQTIDEWVDRALELCDDGSPAHARALIARCYATGVAQLELGDEAVAISERLGDPELLSYALDARADASLRAHCYDEALALTEQRVLLVDELSDLDHLADVYGNAGPHCVAVGRFGEARLMAERADEIASRLSPHHRVHGVSYVLELEELLGGWQRVAELRARTEGVVEANLDTPCIRNMRSLLLCAMAQAECGDTRASRSLETRAESLAMTGHDHILSAPRTRIALARGDRVRLEQLVALESGAGGSWHLAHAAARLDLLAAVGTPERVEQEAPPFLVPGSYLEPFAQRALGVARADDGLLGQAQRRFAALELGWHAEQTERLLALR